jgi:diguanylate cyclase (GGDEF)-like protein/PAS domain S-box-containing protein
MLTVVQNDEIGLLRAALAQAELSLRDRQLTLDKVEAQRRYAERLFSAAFDESPEAISLSRLSDGLFVDINQEWLRLTGFSREEVIGRNAEDFGLWSDQASHDLVMAPLLKTGDLHNLEMTLAMKGGAERLVRLNGTLIDVAGSQHVLMYMKDITAERMADEALRSDELALTQANEQLIEQLRLYELTESLAKVGYWIASPDGQTMTWSAGLHAIVGTRPGSSLSSQEAHITIHRDDLELFSNAREKMDGETTEFRLWNVDGSIRWVRSSMHRQVNIAGELVDFGLLQDITTERAVTHALQDKLDFIEKITSQIPDMVFQYQTRADGNSWFPFVSEAVRTLFRTTPEEARRDARRLFDAIHPEDRDEAARTMKEASVDGGNWNHEFRVKFGDGVERWMLGRSVTRGEPDGTLVSYGSVTDITERKVVEDRVQESEARFRSLTDLSSDWYWEIDEDFRFTRFDGYRSGKSGMTQQDSLGKTRWDLGSLNLNEEDWAAHRATLQAHEQFKDFEIQRLDADGQSYWISLSGTPLFDAQGRFRGYRGIGRDISTRKNNEDETQRLAFYDTLTGLPNRRLVMDRLSQALVSSTRNRQHGALLFIDLDNFKDLNDTLGHDVGDLLLKQVASRLLTCIREGDTAARFGGDEFVVMLESLSEVAEAAASQTEQVVEKILKQLNTPYDLLGKQHNSSPSIGITLFCGNQTSVDELFKRADVAMYQAKAAGRNTMRFYDPEMQAAVMARAALDADLRQGLQRKELLLFYQPVVDVAGHATGVEALLRWNHPKRGLVAPGVFIELAEQTGLILAMGQWVLQAACRQLVAWAQHPATTELTLAVNVSARQFRQPDFVAQVLSVLGSSGANPYRLKLELTESVLLSDVEDAIRKMSVLRAGGVSFALDDFGTGFSSLSYLKRLPLDEVKIDQSFVRDVLTDPNDAAIVRTILALARSMDLVAVAEGVESEGQRRFLLDNGCKVFQGYLFGRPAPLHKLMLPL